MEKLIYVSIIYTVLLLSYIALWVNNVGKLILS